jgi:hypothetical protein
LVFKQTYHARIFRSVGAFFIRKMQNIQKAQLQSWRGGLVWAAEPDQRICILTGQ